MLFINFFLTFPGFPVLGEIGELGDTPSIHLKQMPLCATHLPDKLFPCNK